MEAWDFVNERDLQEWKGGMVCMTCQHFTYGVDRHCQTMVGCNLRQLQQGEHLKKAVQALGIHLVEAIELGT